MYDKGNIINTDLASNLYYNYDLLQEDSSHFGVGSRHKIFHGTSFWMLAVENSQAAYVEITGDTGADGGGVVTTSNFVLGDYKVFVKHINDERKNDPEMSEYTDPSINHIFIVKNTGNHVQDYVNDTNNDYHRISGFESGEDFVYTLIAGDRGYQYSRDEQVHRKYHY